MNLTLDEYKQTLVATSLAQQLADAPAPAPGAPPPAPAPAATLTHLTLTSADLESMGLCSHCRYPCYLRWGGELVGVLGLLQLLLARPAYARRFACTAEAALACWADVYSGRRFAHLPPSSSLPASPPFPLPNPVQRHAGLRGQPLPAAVGQRRAA